MPYLQNTSIPHTLENGKTITVHIKVGEKLFDRYLGWLGMEAQTLWNTIHVNKEGLSDQGLTHELKHVDQWHRYGLVGFAIRYLYYQIRYGYDKNPLEQEARIAAGEGAR